jgi:N-acetylglucosaminyldiphosphoundecaprenol N-acetyl-beta-D-mannosaminyltransferase
MIERFTFQGVKISVINQQLAIDFLKEYSYDKPSYICFPDSFTVFSAAKNNKLLGILNNTCLTMPDGKPLEAYARYKGYKSVKTVSGFWTVKTLLADSNIRHFFYGSTPEVLKNLEQALKRDFPEARIVGFKSPPFVSIDEIETDQHIKSDISEISALGADIIWVGISSPKQDYLIAHYHNQLTKGLMIGIGGVFEYLSGDVKKSPEWIKKIGFRWLYRLIKEPKRLWRKYIFVIFGFIKLMAQSLKTKEDE